jgi:hypothetical protein
MLQPYLRNACENNKQENHMWDHPYQFFNMWKPKYDTREMMEIENLYKTPKMFQKN